MLTQFCLVLPNIKLRSFDVIITKWAIKFKRQNSQIGTSWETSASQWVWESRGPPADSKFTDIGMFLPNFSWKSAAHSSPISVPSNIWSCWSGCSKWTTRTWSGCSTFTSANVQGVWFSPTGLQSAADSGLLLWVLQLQAEPCHRSQVRPPQLPHLQRVPALVHRQLDSLHHQGATTAETAFGRIYF